MDSAPALSPSEAISASLRMILRGLRAVLGTWGLAPVVAVALYGRLGQTFGRIERMLVRFQAGKLWRRQDVAVVTRQQGARAVAVRMPRRFGWLVLAGKHQAAGYGSQLQHLLSTPEMAQMLAASVQARRVLRPLLRALAVELPWTVDQPRAARPRKPRQRKPGAKPEPFRIPLPRGVIIWARKERALERAREARAELVVKMTQIRMR